MVQENSIIIHSYYWDHNLVCQDFEKYEEKVSSVVQYYEWNMLKMFIGRAAFKLWVINTFLCYLQSVVVRSSGNCEMGGYG